MSKLTKLITTTIDTKSFLKRAMIKITEVVRDSSSKASGYVKESIPSSFAFVSVDDLLKWSEKVTESAATIYDKALDASYLKTKIGGGNHRMFDEGHDLVSAWTAAKDTLTNDSLKQEVIGYATSLWKDVTTVKGLPFITWTEDNYDVCAEWVSNCIPWASKDWFYDLMSFDVFEVLSASIGTAGAVFLLSRGDKERLSEILGSMGIVSITSANPMMGIAVVFCTAYSYLIKKNKIDEKKLCKGAGMAGISVGIFGVLGMPILAELAIVIIATNLIRHKVIENDELLEFFKARIPGLLFRHKYDSLAEPEHPCQETPERVQGA